VQKKGVKNPGDKSLSNK